jgi:hypothetical protein
MIDISNITEYSITNAIDLIIVSLQSEDYTYPQLDQILESKFTQSNINTAFALKRSEDLGFIKSKDLGEFVILYSITKLGIEVDLAGGYEKWAYNKREQEEIENHLKKAQLDNLKRTNKYFATNQVITIISGIIGIVGGVLGAYTFFEGRPFNESSTLDPTQIEIIKPDSVRIDSLKGMDEK